MYFSFFSLFFHSFKTTPHLVDLLLVQVEDLSRGGGGDLFVGTVPRLGAVATVPRQHKHHLGREEEGRVHTVGTGYGSTPQIPPKRVLVTVKGKLFPCLGR